MTITIDLSNYTTVDELTTLNNQVAKLTARIPASTNFLAIVNVKDFGAIDDGITDDTPAINLVIDYTTQQFLTNDFLYIFRLVEHIN